ncbi:MAG TPA: hypothetical protein VLT16_17115 [Candidatus Limnocylindrales bacterium]|nr:hypothetical protein [Candidatus Limnocylindrales bacterium]
MTPIVSSRALSFTGKVLQDQCMFTWLFSRPSAPVTIAREC